MTNHQGEAGVSEGREPQGEDQLVAETITELEKYAMDWRDRAATSQPTLNAIVMIRSQASQIAALTAEREASERIIGGLNKQLTEQFELSTKYVAKFNAAEARLADALAALKRIARGPHPDFGNRLATTTAFFDLQNMASAALAGLPFTSFEEAASRATLSRLTAAEKKGGDEAETLCSDCPRVGYPTDRTRCLPCPRRASPSASEVHATLKAEAAETLSNTIEGGK